MSSRKRPAAPSPPRRPPPPSPPPPAAPEKVRAVEPVEQRWEETEGKYLHKKFKKMATASAASEDVPVTQPHPQVPQPPPPALPPHSFPLKHSALSMLSSPRPSQPPPAAPTTTPSSSYLDESLKRKLRNTCPFCQHVCSKPSVLDKHIRTHTNERPFPCTKCGFAFKTKSNLYKHCKSRTHALKVEQGVDSPSTEILEELGSEGRREEIESPSLAPPAIASPPHLVGQQPHDLAIR